MKNKTSVLGLLFLMLLVNTKGISQTACHEGNFIIDPYLGFPALDLWSSVDYNEISDKGEYHGAPFSLGIRGEYLIADNFGIGLDVNYASFGYYLLDQYEETVYDESTGEVQTKIIDRERTSNVKKFRAMLRLNYHFVQNEKLDVLVGVGGGYRNVERTLNTNGTITDPYSEFDIPINFSFRLGLGMHYYFTDNLGLQLEFGTSGGGLLQLGLSAKF